VADEVREYLRAAQEAELRKDVPAAVDRLRQAASLYSRRGSLSRAVSVLRHALRIGPGTEGLAEELAEAEAAEAAGPEVPARVPEVAPSPELQAALDALDDERELVLEDHPVARAPVPATAGLEAWCSFCCQPAREVGALAAGASGTFICGPCAEASCLLTGRTLQSVPLPAASPVLPSAGLSAASVRAAAQVEVALAHGARLVVVTGPPGSGKSRFLSRLLERGLGVVDAKQASGKPVILKDAWALPSTEQRAWLARLGSEPSLRLVLEIRSHVEATTVPVARGADGAVAFLLGAAELSALLSVDWPASALDAVETVGRFEPMTDSELAAHGRALLSAREPACDVSEGLLALVVRRAQASGRGVAELEAQLRRLPPGRWTLPDEAGG
jgi:hypothetical protein